MKKPEEYFKLIDEKYREAKRNRLSRFSVEWGVWSREMNLELRERIETGDEPEAVKSKLKYVFCYWIAISNALELYHKSRIFGQTKRKKFLKEAKYIKNNIHDCDRLKGLTMENIQRMILAR